MISNQRFRFSERTNLVQQSGIRAAGLKCAEIGGINLGQGLCEIPTADIIKQAATEAINNDNNTYSTYEGILPLRTAISKKMRNFNHIAADPGDEIMISNGSTGAFVCATSALFNSGDEVILFEPFYEYHKKILELHQVIIKTVSINIHDLSIDFEQLHQAISHRTRGIVICTPCNPCGKVFSEEELLSIGELAEKFDLHVITDEIYEYITYPGFQHISFASLREFKKRTVTISGFSKTYNMTGWRIGYACGPSAVIDRMSLIHDLLYICPATPLQHGALAALTLNEEYYSQMSSIHLGNRNLVVSMLRKMGLEVVVPQGTYYIMADFSSLKFVDDLQATSVLLEEAKIATVPGRSFYVDSQRGQHQLRVCYALGKEKVLKGLQQMESTLKLY